MTTELTLTLTRGFTKSESNSGAENEGVGFGVDVLGFRS